MQLEVKRAVGEAERSIVRIYGCEPLGSRRESAFGTRIELFDVRFAV